MSINNLTQEALSTVAQLAARARVLEVRQEQLDEEARRNAEELRRVVEEALPAAMAELGLSQLRLDTGESITIRDEIYAGIPKAREFDALNWLRAHGLDDVIKNQVTLNFGKGEDDKASAALALLAGIDCPYNNKQSVHPQTLKALAREKIEAGDPMPEDLFGIHIINRAVIKRS